MSEYFACRNGGIDGLARSTRDLLNTLAAITHSVPAESGTQASAIRDFQAAVLHSAISRFL
jgi:hypothetical protein